MRRRHARFHHLEQYPEFGPWRARRGVFLGVCRGLAQHFDFSVTGMRLLFAAAAVLTGFWPMLAGYLLAALLMRVEPARPLHNDAEAEFYASCTASRRMALTRLKRSLDQLERRIQRMESTVTAKNFDWEQRLRKGTR